MQLPRNAAFQAAAVRNAAFQAATGPAGCRRYLVTQPVLNQIMQAAFAGYIEDERLRTMLYALQVAISNLRSGRPSGGHSPR